MGASMSVLYVDVTCGCMHYPSGMCLCESLCLHRMCVHACVHTQTYVNVVYMCMHASVLFMKAGQYMRVRYAETVGYIFCILYLHIVIDICIHICKKILYIGCI